jgi:4-amino-4-deoxy-L-arabinose transferase-like glycosyltransferase
MPDGHAMPAGRSLGLPGPSAALADRLMLALVFVWLAWVVAGAFAAGTCWDEDEHRRYGELALDFYASFGAERGAVTDRMHYYGALHALAGALFERALPFLAWPHARHLATVAFGLVAFTCAVRLARLLGGPWVGLVAALVLALTPRWSGDAMYNPIDVPAAAGFAAALLVLTRIAGEPERAPRRAWILFGLASGATLAVRTVGLLLFVAAGFVLVAWAARARSPRGAELRAHGPRLALNLALAALLAFAMAAALWPRLLVEPVAALADSLAQTRSFPWKGTVFFRGQNVSALELPRAYLPVWLWLSTPIAVLLGLLGLAVFGLRGAARELRRRVALVAFALGFPLVFAVATRATLYDGIRHFLFVLPPLAALAALGWGAAHARLARAGGARRWIAPALLALVLAEPLVWCVRSFPLTYPYFSPLAGGLARASHAYESEYYGLSLRSAAEWLVRERAATRAPEATLVVGSNAPWHLITPWLDEPARYRWVPLALATDVGREPIDVLLTFHRFLNFRVRPELEPAAELRLVLGQVPFWQAYSGAALAAPPR